MGTTTIPKTTKLEESLFSLIKSESNRRRIYSQKLKSIVYRWRALRSIYANALYELDFYINWMKGHTVALKPYHDFCVALSQMAQVQVVQQEGELAGDSSGGGGFRIRNDGSVIPSILSRKKSDKEKDCGITNDDTNDDTTNDVDSENEEQNNSSELLKKEHMQRYRAMSRGKGIGIDGLPRRERRQRQKMRPKDNSSDISTNLKNIIVNSKQNDDQNYKDPLDSFFLVPSRCTTPVNSSKSNDGQLNVASNNIVVKKYDDMDGQQQIDSATTTAFNGDGRSSSSSSSSLPTKKSFPSSVKYKQQQQQQQLQDNSSNEKGKIPLTRSSRTSNNNLNIISPYQIQKSNLQISSQIITHVYQTTKIIVEPMVHLRSKIIEGSKVTLSLLLGDTILETLGQEELRVRDAWGEYFFPWYHCYCPNCF